MTSSPINYASPTMSVSQLSNVSDGGSPPLRPGTPYPWVFNLRSSQEGPPGPSNHLYHPDIIRDTWELAQAAKTWFHQNPDDFPKAILTYYEYIVTWLDNPRPLSWTELAADHKYPYLYRVLQAHSDELTPYCLERSYSPLSASSKENQLPMPPPSAASSSSGGSLARALAVNPEPPMGRPSTPYMGRRHSRTVHPMGTGATPEQPTHPMMTLGWTCYDPSIMNHYPLTYFDLANNETTPTPWFKITKEGHETTLHGSASPFGPRFCKPLRARPYPMPNFNRTTSFRDDSIDIFDNHSHN